MYSNPNGLFQIPFMLNSKLSSPVKLISIAPKNNNKMEFYPQSFAGKPHFQTIRKSIVPHKHEICVQNIEVELIETIAF